MSKFFFFFRYISLTSLLSKYIVGKRRGESVVTRDGSIWLGKQLGTFVCKHILGNVLGDEFKSRVESIEMTIREIKLLLLNPRASRFHSTRGLIIIRHYSDWNFRFVTIGNIETILKY